MALLWGAAGVALVPLFLIVGYVLYLGVPALNAGLLHGRPRRLRACPAAA